MLDFGESRSKEALFLVETANLFQAGYMERYTASGCKTAAKSRLSK